jgi:hypothetical protein
MTTLEDAQALLAKLTAEVADLTATAAADPTPEDVASPPAPAPATLADAVNGVAVTALRARYESIRAQVDAGRDVTAFAQQLLRLADEATQ